ncbi:MAG: hypothetical protein ABI823_02335 [Bryobacteraceae bacterium]
MHRTNDELLDKLYGIANVETENHLKTCAECASRWERLSMQRTRLESSPVVSDEFLAAQRRKIYARIEEKPPVWWHAMFSQKGFAAGLAALLVVAGGLAFFSTGQAPIQAPKTVVAESQMSDTQFFAEMASIEQSPLPQPAKPIKALFVQEQ